MTAARDFSGTYSPGGQSRRSRYRANAKRHGRKGGLASGKARRRLARGRKLPPRARSRQTALALRYPVRQVKRKRFEALYRAQWPEPERGTAAVAWQRGLETCWQHYQARFRRYRVAGQHYYTTKPQCAVALAKRGRTRCPRTVQRCNRRLEAMGVLLAAHDRRGGAERGRKDRLRMEIRTPARLACPTPSSKGGEPPYGLRFSPPTATSTTSDPPPSAAEEVAAGAADVNGTDSTEQEEPPVSEVERLEAAIRLEELVQRDYPGLAQRGKLGYLRACLRAELEGRNDTPDGAALRPRWL